MRNNWNFSISGLFSLFLRALVSDQTERSVWHIQSERACKAGSGLDCLKKWHQKEDFLLSVRWRSEDEELTYPSISHRHIREHFTAFSPPSVKESQQAQIIFFFAALIVNLLSSEIRLFHFPLKLSQIASSKPAAVHWGLCCVEYILRGPLIIIFAPSSNLYHCLYIDSRQFFVYGYFLSAK